MQCYFVTSFCDTILVETPSKFKALFILGHILQPNPNVIWPSFNLNQAF